MNKPSDDPKNWSEQREKIIGLGERSLRKTYYPELQRKLDELERFRALLDQSNDCIFLLEVPSLAFIDVNESACRQLRCPRQKFLSSPLESLLPREAATRVRELVAFGHAEGRDQDTVTTHLYKCSGDMLPVEIVIRLVTFNKKTYGVAVARDITERKRAQEALRKAHEELEQKVVERTKELSEANVKLQELDRLKSMFIASMSHELRTPLNSVIGFSSILLNEWVGPLNEVQKENIAVILRSGKHLLALINDVIDVSKIEAGKIEPVIESFDIDDLIADAVNMIGKNVEGKGLELKLKSIHLMMNTDRRRLFECVINLLTNAVKFTESGYVRVYVRRVGDLAEISVEDTGMGIREEDVPKLFQPFVRLVSPDKAVIPGSGLGLYLTGRLVKEVLKGDITCKSAYGRGSLFSIRLPIRLNEKSTGYRG